VYVCPVYVSVEVGPVEKVLVCPVYVCPVYVSFEVGPVEKLDLSLGPLGRTKALHACSSDALLF
jgi:hypothetical protein